MSLATIVAITTHLGVHIGLNIQSGEFEAYINGINLRYDTFEEIIDAIEQKLVENVFDVMTFSDDVPVLVNRHRKTRIIRFNRHTTSAAQFITEANSYAYPPLYVQDDALYAEADLAVTAYNEATAAAMEAYLAKIEDIRSRAVEVSEAEVVAKLYGGKLGASPDPAAVTSTDQAKKSFPPGPETSTDPNADL